MRLRDELDAISRVDAGEDVGAVASHLGVDRDWVEELCGRFHEAGRKELSRDLVRPGLDDVLANRQFGFPVHLLAQVESAASFFCAEFFGRTEVIHLYRLAVPAVLLVDIDHEKLKHMSSIYPDEWRVSAGDAYDLADRLHLANKTFELVTCDAYESARVMFDESVRFSRLTTRFLVLNCRGHDLPRLGVDGEYVERFPRVDSPVEGFNLISVDKRSNHQGGMYWATFVRA